MIPSHPEPRAWRRVLASCVVSAAAAALAAPALAADKKSDDGKKVIDQKLIDILEQLRDEQRDEFKVNVDRWEEVAELLEAYVEYSQAEAERHRQWQQNQTLLSKEEKSKLAKDFQQLAAGVREIKGKDVTSQALAAGLAAGAGAAGGGAGGVGFSFDLASLANLQSLFNSLGDPERLVAALATGSSAPDDLKKALAQVVDIWDQPRLDEMAAQVQRLQAGGGLSAYGGEKLMMANRRLKHGMDEQLRNLEQVQATAQGTGARLALIEALVQQAGSLGGTDASGKPIFDATKLAELRTYLGAVTAMQNEELVKLQAKDMGDRATANLLRQGAEAQLTNKALQRATGK